MVEVCDGVKLGLLNSSDSLRLFGHQLPYINKSTIMYNHDQYLEFKTYVKALSFSSSGIGPNRSAKKSK